MSLAAARSRPSSNSTAALYRQWAQGVHDDLLLMGVVKTADTGQVDWTRVRSFSDVTTTSGLATISSAGAAGFTAADVGQGIQITGAGAGGAVLSTTILSVQSSTAATLATNAGTSVVGTAATTIGPHPPATSTAGSFYNIFRFDDALQATLPVFFKIHYATGNTSSDTGVFFRLGTGTDGAGNLTGQLTPSNRNCTVNSANSASNQTWIFCGDTNRVLVIAQTTLTAVWGFVIERSHDSNGDDTAEGINIFLFASSSAKVTQYVPAVGTVPAEFTSVNAYAPNSTTTSGSYGTDLAIYPVFPSQGGRFFNPFLGLVAYFNGDVLRDTQGEITHYGDPHNYYFVGGDISSFGNASNLRPAARFEV